MLLSSFAIFPLRPLSLFLSVFRHFPAFGPFVRLAEHPLNRGFPYIHFEGIYALDFAPFPLPIFEGFSTRRFSLLMRTNYRNEHTRHLTPAHPPSR